MPKALDSCVRKVKARGLSESRAFAICTASLQEAGVLKKGTQKLAKPEAKSTLARGK